MIKMVQSKFCQKYCQWCGNYITDRNITFCSLNCSNNYKKHGITDKMRVTWNRIIAINNKYKPEWNDWNMETFGLGVAKESGEVCDIISVWVGGGTNKKEMPTHHKAMEECFDIIVYITMFAQRLGFTFDDFMKIAEEKIDIVEKRLLDAKLENDKVKMIKAWDKNYFEKIVYSDMQPLPIKCFGDAEAKTNEDCEKHCSYFEDCKKFYEFAWNLSSGH